MGKTAEKGIDMIRVIDTYEQISGLFEGGTLCMDKWRAYMNAIYDGSAAIFEEDLQEYFADGKYTFEKDFLPVINAVYDNPALEELHQSFTAVTEGLNAAVLARFGRELDIDVVLYLGLGNGAGWVTRMNGADTVLLGVEKILKLNWQTVDGMVGLIYHELGHAYHRQHGAFDQRSDDPERRFVWQLFTEGIAMYFEQALVGDFAYFHQDQSGWKAWCDGHFRQILTDFDRDLPTMTRMNQRYFGDWADYHGHGDVGYYLGARWVQRLAEECGFDQLIRLNMDEVCDRYRAFAAEHTENGEA